MRLAIALLLCAGAAFAQEDQRGARFSLGAGVFGGESGGTGLPGAGVNLVRNQHWRAGARPGAGAPKRRAERRDWRAIVRASVARLEGDAAASPITRDRTQYTAGILAAYEF